MAKNNLQNWKHMAHKNGYYVRKVRGQEMYRLIRLGSGQWVADLPYYPKSRAWATAAQWGRENLK